MLRNRLRKFRRTARVLSKHAELLRERRTAARLMFAFCGLATLAFVAVMFVASDASALSVLTGGGAPLLAVGALMLPRPLLEDLAPKQGYGGEGSVAVFELKRGLLYRGIVLHGVGIDTLSVAATSVKTFGCPIDRIDVEAENGTVLHSVRPSDLVREKMMEARQPLASMLTPPTVVTATANGFSFDIPLSFQLDDVEDGADFLLPSWQYEQVQVKVYFTNTHANLYTGGTGVVTMSELSLSCSAVVDLPRHLTANPAHLPEQLEVLLRSYKEQANPAAVNREYTLELPRTADIERIYIVQEDANRDPVNTLVSKVSLIENGVVRRVNKLPFNALRSMNSENQQATLPVGVAVIDFTRESNTIRAALPATKMNSLVLELETLAVAGTIRAYMVRRAPKAAPRHRAKKD